MGWSTYNWETAPLTITGKEEKNNNISLSIPFAGHLFTICGVQRCGNHAIINWAMNHFNKDKSIHINNIGIGSEVANPKENCEAILYSYENHRPADVISHAKHPLGKLYAILRDPYNWFASLLGLNQSIGLHHYIKYYFDYVDFIRCNHRCFINYNQWVMSENYKRELRSRMDLPNINVCNKSVSAFGGGSSFDKMRLDGRANEMEVMYRWKGVLKNPHYVGFLRDHRDRIRQVGIDLFDYDPGIL